mgnify:CR=1 FL=1|jgi:hypothetical protein
MLNSYLRIFIELCIGGIISGLLVSIWDGFLTKIQKKENQKQTQNQILRFSLFKSQKNHFFRKK